ncbi:MAG: helix-turn-helix transcriptional regulator, partial [Anaerolineae bacterium]|nr:helix-turn-helix transcriptional regulator [Anaerolineae bacterium]
MLSKGPNHGYQIEKAIKQQSEGILDFKEGTLYPALHGLEEQGMIEAIEREENGRLRRYYRLTQDGHA